MNKIRIEIINLIGDYMDKTLSEGCLFINNRLKSKRISKISNQRYGWITFNSIGVHSSTKEKIIGFAEYHKILGHYDITALLKFIAIEKQIRFTEFGDDNIYFYDDKNDIFIGKIKFKIPNKPLHLYIEEEEKELLELLLKLKDE